MPTIEKIKFHDDGFVDVLKSEGVRNLITELTTQRFGMCGEGYEMAVDEIRTRVAGEIRAVTRKAKKDNIENNTLAKLVGG